MLLNACTALVTPRLVLVPYRPEHVPNYNTWMQSPELQHLTASEPLTLAEEYEMCTSWKEDPDKLTFIVLERDLDVSVDDEPAFRNAHGVERMIGDVNLFLSPSPLPHPLPPPHPPTHLAEIELMIASPAHRRIGLAPEILHHFLAFARLRLGIKKGSFCVKIGVDNLGSLRLFTKVGFVKYKEVQVFREVEMRWPSSTGTGDESGDKDEWPWECKEGWAEQGRTLQWP